MKNLFLISIAFCLWLAPIRMAAEKVVVKTDEKWKDNENDRSLPSVPTLSIDEQNLYVRSSVELTNLDVCIRDSYGNIAYSGSHNIPAGGMAVIPAASFSEGEYTLYIYEGSRYVIATIIN